MSQKEESLDEKIARIRKQNEAIERRKKLIDEEIENAKKNNALVQLKVSPMGNEKDRKFGATLYSDQLSPEKKTAKPVEEDIWNVKPRLRKSAPQPNKIDEAWREERKRIDEERIQRQKANSGSWKREWDADKIASSYDRDTQTPKETENRFNRSSSLSEHLKNSGNNFNASKGGSNHSDRNENDTSQSPRKTHPEQRASEYDNRKPTISESDTRKNVLISDGDRYNNNATKIYSRNKSKNNVQSTLFTTKGDQFDEESWDVKFTHDNIATKLHSKSNWKTSTNVEPFTTTTSQQQKEARNVEPVGKAPLGKPKPNEYFPGGDAKPRVKSQENERSCVAHNISRSSSSFGNRLAHPVKSPNANTWMTETLENEHKNIEEDSSGKNISFPKEIDNIIVQVKNLGVTNNKREVKISNDSKTQVPKFNVNLSPSGGVDVKTSPSYGSMTFQRSDLKQVLSPKYLENLTSPTSIATQMFSNSKISDNNHLSNVANFKSNSCTEISDNWQKFVRGIQPTSTPSPSLFQFSGTPVELGFGEIAHNTTTLVRETPKIRTSVKELTKIRGNTVSRRTKCVEISPDHQNKSNESVRNRIPENSEVYLDDDEEEDEEWDDCSDEEIEEEFM